MADRNRRHNDPLLLLEPRTRDGNSGKNADSAFATDQRKDRELGVGQ